jgi:tRNA(Ile)-lysidine synthase
MRLAPRVLASLQRLKAGRRILVALSGGADSVALLCLLRELQAGESIELAGAAHLNHQLRGGDADEDERFCAALAAREGTPFISGRVDVATAARAQRRSIEDAARDARYAFLERAADELAADVIAVAHTRDDQAETFLLRLLRGAGTRGLGSIRPRVGRVVRPLIDIGRDELREYLRERGQPFREDASNRDLANPRNRVRHELIPYLTTHFSPGVTNILAREADLARRDEEDLHARAIEIAPTIVLEEEDEAGGVVRLDAVRLAALHPALASRVARGVLGRLAGERFIGFEHVEQLLAMAVPGTGLTAISLPGQVARRNGNVIVLQRRSGRGGRPTANGFRYSLSIPGSVHASDGGWTIAAELARETSSRWASRGVEVGIAADRLMLPLAVRSRRPGDRFRPLGAPGTRKLKDFLVDRKVPRAERDSLPLVVDGRDRIVWVAGQAVAEDFRVTAASQAVILLKVRDLGGSG